MWEEVRRGEKMRRCEKRWEEVRRWEDVRRCEKRWEDEKMSEDVRRCEKRWEDEKMSEDVRRYEKMWEEGRRYEKIWRWEDLKMRGCEDKKIFYRPPLLEEPCAQMLSGKTRLRSNARHCQRCQASQCGPSAGQNERSQRRGCLLALCSVMSFWFLFSTSVKIILHVKPYVSYVTSF